MHLWEMENLIFFYDVNHIHLIKFRIFDDENGYILPYIGIQRRWETLLR